MDQPTGGTEPVLAVPAPPTPNQPPAAIVPTFPIVVRYNPYTGAAFIVVGALLGWIAIRNGDFPVGIIFIVLGVLYLFGNVAIVEPNLVSIKSPIQVTLKRRPINGLGDLYFDGDKLYRRRDNRKILNLGWGTSRTDDLNRLKQAVAAAQPRPDS